MYEIQSNVLSWKLGLNFTTGCGGSGPVHHRMGAIPKFDSGNFGILANLEMFCVPAIIIGALMLILFYFSTARRNSAMTTQERQLLIRITFNVILIGTCLFNYKVMFKLNFMVMAGYGHIASVVVWLNEFLLILMCYQHVGLL